MNGGVNVLGAALSADGGVECAAGKYRQACAQKQCPREVGSNHMGLLQRCQRLGFQARQQRIPAITRVRKGHGQLLAYVARSMPHDQQPGLFSQPKCLSTRLNGE